MLCRIFFYNTMLYIVLYHVSIMLCYAMLYCIKVYAVLPQNSPKPTSLLQTTPRLRSISCTLHEEGSGLQLPSPHAEAQKAMHPDTQTLQYYWEFDTRPYPTSSDFHSAAPNAQ